MRESILLAGGTDKGRALLQSLMPPGQFEHVRVCLTGAETRRALAASDCAVIVINTPLGDESGLELAIEAAHQSSAGVLLLVKADLADTVAMRVRDDGVLVVSKPVARPLFDQALGYALAMRRRLLSVHAENARLEKKLAELRVVDRAKCLLIERQGMTEEQAHRCIEKQAMDTRQTRLAVAQGIVNGLEQAP